MAGDIHLPKLLLLAPSRGLLDERRVACYDRLHLLLKRGWRHGSTAAAPSSSPPCAAAAAAAAAAAGAKCCCGASCSGGSSCCVEARRCAAAAAVAAAPLRHGEDCPQDMRLRNCQRAAAAPISHPYLRARSSLLQERAAAPANSRRVRYDQNRQEEASVEAAYQQDDDYEQEHRHACCWCCWCWRRWWYSSPTAPSPTSDRWVELRVLGAKQDPDREGGRAIGNGVPP